MKFLAIVVLYNPDDMLEKRAKVISKQVDEIIFYDNSEKEDVIQKNRELASKIVNSKYISFGINEGIGKALNFGVRYAEKNGYDYYFTFDQDTLISDNYVNDLFFAIKSEEKVGVVGPIYLDSNTSRECCFPVKLGPLVIRKKLSHNQENIDVMSIITSGSLYHVDIFSEVGLFDESLFIDYIDNEFCLRLLSFGYRVIVYPGIIIKHALGNRKQDNRKFMPSPTNYPFYRKYYITRNRLYIYKKYILKYPGFVLYDLTTLFWDLFRVLIFEQDRKRKMYGYFKGISDFLKNKRGKFEE